MAGVCTLLLTDVVDSTRLNTLLGDERMAALWMHHDAAARELIRQHGGREVGRSDGFLILFDDANCAAAFALGYHRALAAMLPPMQARVGVHVGPVTLRENSAEDRAQGATPFDIDGVALPMAARLMSIARAGQTLMSEAARSVLRAAAGLRQSSHGHWRFKGLDEPIEVIEIGDDATPFQPPDDSPKGHRVVAWLGDWVPAATIAHQLPAERDPFVGRLPWLQRLSGLLDDGARMVTILGIGGIGKTRLALRYARTRLGEYPGGAWFCDLSSSTTAEGVVHSVAQGLKLQLGSGDPVDQIGDALASRGACLVVVDNFEQVAGHAEATLGLWLVRAPLTRFVVTSREVLGLTGEVVMELSPLSPSEGNELFLRRMQGLGVAASTAANDADSVQKLVELLDGLPLAIELAAARARVMSPGELLRGMTDRFKLLARRGGSTERQSTLRAAMEWSWALLSKPERTVSAQLSVFDGGFTLAAAEEVVTWDPVDNALWIGDVIQALVEKSILRRVAADRLDMLRTVHDYLAGQLAGQPQTQAAALQRHWQHFASLDESSLSNQRCNDIENIVAAARRAAAAADPHTAAQAVVVAAAVMQQVGPVSVVLDLADRVRARTDLLPLHRAAIARVQGNAHYSLGLRSLAMQEYEDGLVQALAADEPALIARLSCALAEPLIRAGDRIAAQRHLNAADTACARCADPGLEVIVLNTSGALALAEGRFEEAQRIYLRALGVAQQIGQRRREGGLLGNLGNVLYAMGRAAEAAVYYQQSIEIGEEVGDRRWAANARCNLGLLYSEEGRHAQAVEALTACVATAREIGYSSLEATALCNLGQTLLAQEQAQIALTHLGDAATLAERLNDRPLGIQCHRALAAAWQRLRDSAQASAALRRALALAHHVQDASESAAIGAALEQLGGGNDLDSPELNSRH